MTLIPVPNRMTSPGGGEASLSVSRGKIYFAFSGFQEGSEEKLALKPDGC
jgi:hypothetical protein